MSDTDVKLVFLMRGLGPQESLLFSTYLFLDEGGPDLYVATIAGMNGRLVATGTTEDEACAEAMELFKGMVDHAIEQKQPIDRVVGDVPYKKVPFPVAKAPELFRILTESIVEGQTGDDDEWRTFPLPAMRLEEANV